MASPTHRRFALWLAVAVCAGCGAPTTTPEPAPAPLPPREKFAKFFEEFRGLCAEADTQSVSLRGDGGEGATSFRCVLDPPTYVIDERPDGALFAQVTVVTRTHFSSIARIDLAPPPIEELDEFAEKSPLEELQETRLESREVRPDMQLRITRALESQH
jgi:hypothetical protein